MIRSSKRWKRLATTLLPIYAWIPLGSALLLNCLVYFGTRLVTTDRYHYMMQTPVDDRLPFLSWFIIFYFLAYVQWIIGFILACRESEKVCFHLLSAEIIAKLICLFCFLAFPTTIVRPAFSGHSVFDGLIRMLYKIDRPDNLFPSLHCLESWFCLRSCKYLKKTPPWYFPVSLAVTVLVFLSTVLIKQHVVLDIPGGVLVMETGLALALIFKTGRLFERINLRLMENMK